jgi:hypothetical protein
MYAENSEINHNNYHVNRTYLQKQKTEHCRLHFSMHVEKKRGPILITVCIHDCPKFPID